VPCFAVETYVPAASREPLVRISARARAAAGRGAGVRYLATLFLPEDETCFHVLDAPSPDAAAEVAARAGVRGARVLKAAMVLGAEGAEEGARSSRPEADLGGVEGSTWRGGDAR
jgi:hypothetical protein